LYHAFANASIAAYSFIASYNERVISAVSFALQKAVLLARITQHIVAQGVVSVKSANNA